MTELLEYFVKVFQIYAHAKFFSCFLKSKECHTILGTKVLTDTNQSLPIHNCLIWFVCLLD